MKQRYRMKAIINLILTVPFVLVLSTVFAISKDMANGIISGKYIWFYFSLLIVSLATFFSYCLNHKKISFSLLDLLIALFCLTSFFVTYYHNRLVTFQSIQLGLIFFLYIYIKIFIVQDKWNAFILIVFFVLTGFIEALWGLRQLYGLSPSFHNLFKTTGSFFLIRDHTLVTYLWWPL